MGMVCNPRIIRAIHPLLDSEALRVVKTSPVWKPAKIAGNEVSQNFVIPVEFKLK
jgi:protein TonB